jgi:hypothetical protein
MLTLHVLIIGGLRGHEWVVVYLACNADCLERGLQSELANCLAQSPHTMFARALCDLLPRRD